MKILMVVVMLLAGCGYMVDESEAAKAARAMGFSDVRVTDRSVVTKAWEGCGHDDAVGFDVRATNPAGAKVNLLVCCGAIFKACTVRAK